MSRAALGAELDVAVVGAGPRGLSVLERIVVRSAGRAGRVRIWLFEPGEAGAGRIWRTDQSDLFLMNTAAGEVSAFSAAADDGPVRAGFGPSFAEWLAAHPDRSDLGPNDYAPRPVYGEYLKYAYEAIVRNAPAHVTVHHVTESAIRLHRRDGRSVVVGAYGTEVVADKVVLTTGHPGNRPDETEVEFLDFAAATGTRYLRGDSAADLDLDAIGPGEQVGVIGLGLTFFDVMAAVTIGRGGRFTADGYLASGREPHLVAGSRSGLVMLARGRNQKPPDYRYRPAIATPEAIVAARRAAQRVDGSAQLDFREQVLPLLRLEVDHVYYTGHVRLRYGAQAARLFAERHRALRATTPELLAEYGVADVEPVDLAALARPFGDRAFTGPDHFHAELLDLLGRDIAHAHRGNVDDPLKAALDILRDIRGSVRQAVDFAGLRPRSHQDFLTWFNPINTMVSAGPPAVRVAQACALIRAGVLTVIGPGTRITTGADAFELYSPQVAGSRRVVTTLVDARIPRPDLRANADPLMGRLLSDGLVTDLVNTDPVSGDRFTGGGLAVTRAPFHVIDANGVPDPDLYALGVPTEDTRWFTQIGNGRPGPLTGFHADADALAVDVLDTGRAVVVLTAWTRTFADTRS
ncbi:FAD/NAD(P)-binding protein [Saccharothrix violaceirubra]|uniref:Methylaspartate mutase epsilon subunit n=1 Tax=Saccharothrix violaceirubra TaxID=413306 RepID=A0A7W7TA91_9PSEU|nr:FAD/NAD(P)-binding protein [Saccharothrix violaceirubra]MBB4969412.1 methylaspartate mutase epsilon subunit [Saccharothrix violaceirubra]